jgi:hypothetical protein
MPARIAEAGIAAAVLDISAMAREVMQRVGTDRRGPAQFQSHTNSMKASAQEIATHGIL